MTNPVNVPNMKSLVDSRRPLIVAYRKSGQIKFNRKAQEILGFPETLLIDAVEGDKSVKFVAGKSGIPLTHGKSFGAKGWKGFYHRSLATFLANALESDRVVLILDWSAYHGAHVARPRYAMPLAEYQKSLEQK